jgi:hypothetical protein
MDIGIHVQGMIAGQASFQGQMILKAK